MFILKNMEFQMFSAMNKVRCFGLIGFILLLTACSFEPNDMVNSNKIVNATAPIALKVGEGFVDPIGYYEKTPRFTWQIAPTAQSQFQQAFQIQVASSAVTIEAADLWDSQKQLSANNAWIKYQGKPLASRQKVYWRVRIWDENDQVSSWSKLASIELGLLTNDEWQGQWIRHPETGETYQDTVPRNKQQFTNKLYRPQYLRKDFSASKSVKQARLYVTAKGIFKAYLNGQVISDDVMTPGWTPYRKRIETLTYDVTEFLQQGDNTLAAATAEGWYGGRIISPHKRDVKPHALLAQLEISYQDGTKQTITTDSSWHSTVNGPIRAAGNYDGETYDANFEMPGWNTPEFAIKKSPQQWQQVLVEAREQNVVLSPKRHTATKTKLMLDAQKIVQVANPKSGVVVFDMGQNMVGVPKLNIPVLANQKVTIRFAEALEHNKFYTKNMRSAKATDYYTPATTGTISYTPTFTFHGYRYVELSGYDQNQQPQLNWVKGLVQHSNFDVHANFTSSHVKLNKLAENVVWGLRGNFLDIPTDCPQRDERLGWTGDAQVFAKPSMQMADVYGFWSAWLQTLREDQATDGRIPNFVPIVPGRHDKGTSSGWGDAAVIIPWELYLQTGDSQVLRENYNMMQSWLKFIEAKAKNNVSTLGGFGDWLQPYPQRKKKANRGDTPIHLISTAYLARSLDYASKAAAVLGFEADAKQYAKRFQQVRKAFRTEFYDQYTKVKTPATQASYLLPLAFNLFDDVDITNAQNHLITEIQNADNHLRTGFLGTPLLAPVLQKMGRSDLMFDILFKESYPSWFYSINNGATTTWERWNSYSLKDGFNKEKMNSLNHYAYGAVAQWFYEGILGINAASAGFKEINIAPQFNQRLTNASGSYKTPQGEVKVSWKVVQGKLDMQVTIPKNSRANFVLPQVTSLAINGEKVLTNKALRQLALTKLAPGVYQIHGKIIRG
jgi:alpha-L-rhamnosidase